MPEDSLTKQEPPKRSVLSNLPSSLRVPLEAMQNRNRLFTDNKLGFELLAGISTKLRATLDAPAYREKEKILQKYRATSYKTSVKEESYLSVVRAAEPGMIYVVDVDRDDNGSAYHIKVIKGPPSVATNIGRRDASNYWEIAFANDPKDIALKVHGEEYVGPDNPLVSVAIENRKTVATVRARNDPIHYGFLLPIPSGVASISSFAVDPVTRKLIGPIGDIKEIDVTDIYSDERKTKIKFSDPWIHKDFIKGRYRFVFDKINGVVFLTRESGWFKPHTHEDSGEPYRLEERNSIQIPEAWLNGSALIKVVDKEADAFLAAVKQASEKVQGKLDTGEEQRLLLGDSETSSE